MDRPEIKILAIAFCALVIALRLPGIFWPDRLKAFLSSYGSLGDGVLRALGVLLMALGAAVLFMLCKTMPLSSIIVLAGGLALLSAGILHLRPALPRRMVAAAARQSAITLRLLSIAGVIVAAAAVVYLALRG